MPALCYNGRELKDSNKNNMKEEEQSDFGEGFVYNLFLFAKHFERAKEYTEMFKRLDRPVDYGLWFNGAGDHFYGFEVPNQWKDTELGKRFAETQSNILSFRLGKPTESEFEKVFEELEELCREVDKILGVKSIKAAWN